jgi:putative transposase
MGGINDYVTKLSLACPSRQHRRGVMRSRRSIRRAMRRPSCSAGHCSTTPRTQPCPPRHKAPETNGVIERFYGSLKYEHLYRHEIFDGFSLADLVDGYRDVEDRIRPHDATGMRQPLDVRPRDAPSTLSRGRSVSNT